jgi:hypothetical protein
MLPSWRNDDRLDELAKDVKDGFNEVDARFDKIDQKIEAGFAELRATSERWYRMTLWARQSSSPPWSACPPWVARAKLTNSAQKWCKE